MDGHLIRASTAWGMAVGSDRQQRQERLQGYKQKPRAITVIAGIFLALPLVAVIQAAIAAGGSWDVIRQIVSSGFFRQEWCLAWAAAIAIYIVSRWSFAAFLLLSTYVLYTKLTHLMLQPALETPWSALITCVWFGIAIAVCGSSLRTPYLNPQLRWWTRPPRVPVHLTATLTMHDATVTVRVGNLSRGGAFVMLQDSAASTPCVLCLGDTVRFTTQLSSNAREPFIVQARLVWVGKPETPACDGMGIQFLGLSATQRHQLRSYLRDAAQRTHYPVV